MRCVSGDVQAFDFQRLCRPNPGMTRIDDLRTKARLLFDAAITAADPAKAVRRGLAQSPLPSQKPGGRTFLIAIGKAAPAMLAEAMTAIPDAFAALAVTHHENDTTVQGAEILRAGHPIPDEAGARAAQRVMELLAQAGEDDRVVALMSGGGSALLPAPPQGVSLTPELPYKGDARRVALLIQPRRHHHHRVSGEVRHEKDVSPVGRGDEDVDALKGSVQRPHDHGPDPVGL